MNDTLRHFAGLFVNIFVLFAFFALGYVHVAATYYLCLLATLLHAFPSRAAPHGFCAASLVNLLLVCFLLSIISRFVSMGPIEQVYIVVLDYAAVVFGFAAFLQSGSGDVDAQARPPAPLPHRAPHSINIPSIQMARDKEAREIPAVYSPSEDALRTRAREYQYPSMDWRHSKTVVYPPALESK